MTDPADSALLEPDPHQYLEGMVAGSSHVRHARHRTDEFFAPLTDEELVQAARWMRAVAYSALEGARKFEQIARARS